MPAEDGLPPQGVASEYDWDVAMRDALQHESVAVLQHQLETERQNMGRMDRSDVFFALGLLGLTFGVGYGTGALKPSVPAFIRGKKTRRRG